MLVFEYQEAHFGAAPAPLIFYVTDEPEVLNWIAQGTDGDLYIAPAVAGGWLQRVRYDGPMERLSLIAPAKARMIAWFLFGDTGIEEVAIAQSPLTDANGAQTPGQESRRPQQAGFQHLSDDDMLVP
jgi:hypothetical protein